ncbi:MAG: hypothetical protein WD025_05995 [Bacteriovoracaceae bacterium]
MKFLFVFLLAFSFSGQAQTKAQVKQVLDAMGQSGKVTQAQVAAAKKEIDGMSEEDLSQIVEKAMKLKDNPAMKAKIKSMGLSPDSLQGK